MKRGEINNPADAGQEERVVWPSSDRQGGAQGGIKPERDIIGSSRARKTTTDQKSQKALKNKRPKGFYRRKCKENPPKNKGMRSIVENVNYVLKETQIASLRSKKHSMRERELGWHLIFYNLKKIIRLTKSNEVQTFLFFQIRIYVFPDNTIFSKPF